MAFSSISMQRMLHRPSRVPRSNGTHTAAPQPAFLSVRVQRPFVNSQAAYNFGSDNTPPAVTAAATTLAKCLDLIKKREFLKLTDYLSNNVLDASPSFEVEVGTEVTPFEDVIGTMLLESPERHFLDSYAIRHLVLSTPAHMQVLSGLLLAPDRFIQRVAVTSRTGEEAVLTFTLTATSVPVIDQNIARPEDLGSEAAVSAQKVGDEVTWKLASVKGEPSLPEVPQLPSPEFSPEAVVQGSLQALKERDLSTPFRLLSPASQALLDCSLDRFVAAVRDNKRYSTLYGHLANTSIRRCQYSSSTYLELVACISASGAHALFCYILSRQGANSPAAGSWCIDHVKVLDDPLLLNAIDQTWWSKPRK